MALISVDAPVKGLYSGNILTYHDPAWQSPSSHGYYVVETWTKIWHIVLKFMNEVYIE